MSRQRSQSGYILPVTLLLLSCTLLWGSALLLTLSDQYEASNAIVKQEQSRLLACSGWNLAIKQLEETGTTDNLQIHKEFGKAEVHLQQEEELIMIQVWAEAGDYSEQITGTVELIKLIENETPEDETMENKPEDSSSTVSGYQVQVVERVVG